MTQAQAQSIRRHWFAVLLRFLWRLLRAFVTVVLLVALLLVLVGAWVYYEYGKDLPDPTQIGRIHPSETTRIFARDGTTLLYELVDPHEGRRTLVRFDQIPDTLKHATIAVEDANFYKHPGVDSVGILRALWLNYQQQEIVSGGSTITQQLVRNVLLSPEEREQPVPVSEEQRYERKLREAILAYRVSNIYSKDEILGLYLNEVYYGAQAYGVEAAAQNYFGKHVWELTDGEATLLAGLPQSPTTLNPYTNMDGARKRQDITLGLMVKYGYLTPDQQTAIAAEPITLVTPTVTIAAPHFAFYVRDVLEERYGTTLLYSGGLSVTTSLDMYWQAEAERIARQHIAELQQRNAHNAAVVILSPTGEILAMVGGVDYTSVETGGQVNVAIAPRQPGSALKPIIYAAAFQRGWTPATIIWDTPTDFAQDGWTYTPVNYDNSWHGPQRVRMALANSLNIPAVKALAFVGIEPFVQLASQMGITTLRDPSRYSLAMALGSNEVRLLDLTTVYNTFRNGGRYQKPAAILRVETSRGEVLERHAPGLEPQVLGNQGEQIAYLITSILSDNQARQAIFGAGNVMELPDGRPAAVKTGTSNEWRDSWAVGYTPGVTIGVWVGNNDNSPMQEVAGANGAGRIWRDLMLAYHQGQAPQPFPRPDGMVEREICAGTGTIPDTSCPTTVVEYFIAGMEPEPSHVSIRTVNVGGDGHCLAASYTPPGEIRPLSFAVYPPEFRDWAVRNGIPQPPTEPCPQPQSPDKAMALLMPVSDTGIVESGQVFISGTARAAYRLEIGNGHDPQSWYLLNQGSGGIQNGLLGSWITSGYAHGEYTLRLSVTTREGLVVEARQTVWYK